MTNESESKFSTLLNQQIEELIRALAEKEVQIQELRHLLSCLLPEYTPKISRRNDD